VVGATVATARRAHGGVGELARDKGHVGGQAGVNVVLEDNSTSTRGVTRHVLVQEGQDICTSRTVVAEDVSRAQQATLLATVPVELDGVLGGEAGVGENAEGLEQVDGASAIIVGARGASSGGASSRVEVGADNDWATVSGKSPAENGISYPGWSCGPGCVQ
jgi:hypothetical protein